MAERGLAMGRHRVRTLMRLNGLLPADSRSIVARREVLDGQNVGCAAAPGRKEFYDLHQLVIDPAQ